MEPKPEGVGSEGIKMSPFWKTDVNNDCQVCCICGRHFDGFGNNPAPVKSDGRCCDGCNWTEVIPARIDRIVKRGDKKMEGEL